MPGCGRVVRRTPQATQMERSDGNNFDETTVGGRNPFRPPDAPVEPQDGPLHFGERHGIYIFDLQKTMRLLQNAYTTVRDKSAKGGRILFLGTKKQARETVRQEAERCGMYFVNHRWLGGMLTNWETIQKSVRKLKELEEMESSGTIEQFTKKEGTRMRKHREKLDRNLCGIKDMSAPPDVLFVIDSSREAIAVREAERLGITSVAVVDTNSDPDAVEIPIPGNDDAIRAIALFCSLMADAVIEGRAAYEKAKAEEDEEAAKVSKSSKVEKEQSKVGGHSDEPIGSLAAAEAADAQGDAEPATAEVAVSSGGDGE